MKKDKKKNKKKKKSNFSLSKLLLIIAIVIGFIVGLYFFLIAEDEESNLSLLDKQWIESNKDKLININVVNNLSILGMGGEGVLFDFVEDVEDAYELSFNKISYNYPSSFEKDNNYGLLVLGNNDKLEDKDILMTEDNYVLVGRESGIFEDITSINGASVGVINSDKVVFSEIYKNNNINFRGFSNIDNLFTAINDKLVDYIIVPKYYALENIIENNYSIKYNFNNISNKVVLRLGNDKRFNDILVKYLSKWMNEEYRESLEETFIDFYVDNSNITDVEKKTLSSKVYTYGYVKGSAYNEYKNDKLYGVAGEYVNTLSNMVDMEFKVIEFTSKEKLIGAINRNEVDIAFIDFEFENEKVLTTSNNFNSNMVVLSKNIENITDKNGLVNRKLYLLKDNFLYKYISDNVNSTINTIKNVDQEIDDDGLLLLDEVEYFNCKTKTNLSDYNLIFVDKYVSDYHYVVTKNNNVLHELFDFVLANINYDEFRNISINNLNATYSNENNFKYIYLIIVSIILLPIILLVLAVSITKSSTKFKIRRKENVLKYNDMLTSLKNRNYLNEMMEEWDEMPVLPRTVIIADLNNLKYVNDNYGTEEGNSLIKKAAAILINTQLEKSEIIRTDGNEFLIYLIGYNKNQINTYISKLSKEFEKLPYGFGAAIGYSMIEDEIKTVEDAINEASISMREDKEQNFK